MDRTPSSLGDRIGFDGATIMFFLVVAHRTLCIAKTGKYAQCLHVCRTFPTVAGALSTITVLKDSFLRHDCSVKSFTPAIYAEREVHLKHRIPTKAWPPRQSLQLAPASFSPCESHTCSKSSLGPRTTSSANTASRNLWNGSGSTAPLHIRASNISAVFSRPKPVGWDRHRSRRTVWETENSSKYHRDWEGVGLLTR